MFELDFFERFFNIFIGLKLGMAMRMRKYAVHAEYVHICKYAEAGENLIHIIHA